MTVCEIENKQKHKLEKINISLTDTIHNLTQIKVADSECYAVTNEFYSLGPC